MENKEEYKRRLKEKLSESIDYSTESTDEEIQDLIDEMLTRESRVIPLTIAERHRLRKGIVPCSPQIGCIAGTGR